MALACIERWNSTATGSVVTSFLVLIGLFEAFKALIRLATGVKSYGNTSKAWVLLEEGRMLATVLDVEMHPDARNDAGVYIYFLRPGKNIKRYGPWAVITGATDGIGRAYAEAIASKGLNVVLISRTKAKLDTAASEIESKYNVKTAVVAADFSKADEQTWLSIKDALDPLDVGLLINNVGLSYDHAEYFDQLDDQLIDDLVNINIQTTNKMTKLLVPKMKARKQSSIVNIGSAAATVAPCGPFYSVYAGTKAYVDMFSKSMNLEYASSGISVQNQAPAFVTTKMSKIRRASMDVPTPKRWVADAIKHIGYEATSCPYWYHGIMWALSYNLPTKLSDAYLSEQGAHLRKRYYKKLERQAKKA